MPYYRIPLVGMHFRPPAKMVLSCLPSGTAFVLRRERDNPYDSEAVKVILPAAGLQSIPHEGLEVALEGTGWDAEDVTSLEELFIGYLAAKAPKGAPPEAEYNSVLSVWDDLSGFKVKLEFFITGMPYVKVTIPTEDCPKVLFPRKE